MEHDAKLPDGLYFCDGCRKLFESKEVFPYHGTWAHERIEEDGRPEVCGQVSDQKWDRESCLCGSEVIRKFGHLIRCQNFGK